MRLWVDSQLVIDDWTFHDTTDDSAAVVLSGGQFFDIHMEYMYAAGPSGGETHLLWQTPSTDPSGLSAEQGRQGAPLPAGGPPPPPPPGQAPTRATR